MESSFESLRRQSTYLLTALKENPKIDGALQTSVNFSSYSSLFLTISDLMKLCTLALLSEEPYLSPIIGNTTIDLAGIMELALQLMPRNEGEFLDEARAVFQSNHEQELPQSNYSTITVWKKEAY